MHNIEIFGGKAKEREIAETAVWWCVQRLLPRVRTLNIEIRLKKLDGAMGYCLNTDNHKSFEIEINKGMRLFDLISTVCYEMVHVKQYYRRELRHRTAGGKIMWKTKAVNDSSIAYTDLPWEKEAFKMECELTIECFTELNVSF